MGGCVSLSGINFFEFLYKVGIFFKLMFFSKVFFILLFFINEIWKLLIYISFWIVEVYEKGIDELVVMVVSKFIFYLFEVNMVNWNKDRVDLLEIIILVFVMLFRKGWINF